MLYPLSYERLVAAWPTVGKTTVSGHGSQTEIRDGARGASGESGAAAEGAPGAPAERVERVPRP